MTIKTFIEKAIAGGWKSPERWHTYVDAVKDTVFNYHAILLDPLFWQAVGKTEGWPTKYYRPNPQSWPWRDNMHRMIDSLAEGKSIEEFLSTL